MSTSENAELDDLIDRAFTSMGKRASLDDVMHVVGPLVGTHLYEYATSQWVRTRIGRYFRQRSTDGLPQAPEANIDGLHVQLDLLTVPEYAYAIKRQMDQSVASRRQAQKLADLCAEVHGVVIDIEHPDASAA